MDIVGLQIVPVVNYSASDFMIYHGILQVRILEWVDFPYSRGSYQSRDQAQAYHIEGGFFTS